MENYWQLLSIPISIFLLSALVTLLVLYLVIRLAVMHALRDHVRWEERMRLRATRTTYPDPKRFPPITPESHEPF